MQRYDGQGILVEHLEKCKTQWRKTPPKEWPHHFIDTLEGIPGNCYTDQEMHKGTTKWTRLQHNFVVTFSIEHENPKIDSTLKMIRGNNLLMNHRLKS